MPYREKLMANAKKWGEEIFASSIRILEAEYQKVERRNEAGQIFTDLFAQWAEFTKEKAACLGICYLHTSIIMRTGEVRLTLYGKEVYMDINQLEKSWQPPCFFQQYEQDMTMLMKKLRNEHPRIYPYEEDAVRISKDEQNRGLLYVFRKMERGGREAVMYRNYLTLTAQKGNPVPQIVNWYGKLDVRNVNRKDYRKIPVPLMLEMRTGVDVVYPDIMTFPLLLVSEEAMEVILLYDKEMPFFFVALFDTLKEESASYYCPVLPEEAAGGTEALYWIRRREGDEIRICEELAESLMERGAVGMELNAVLSYLN